MTQVLRLNPLAVVVPLERDHLQVTLIDPGRPLPDLHVVALTNRPELASYQALVQAAVARIRRERGRMLLPTVLINGFQTPDEMIQGGIFGIGPNNKLNQWAGRDDVSLQLMWELEGLGIGNLAQDQRAARRAIEGHHRFLPDPGHGRGGRDPNPGRSPVGGSAASLKPIVLCARASPLSTEISRACSVRPGLATSSC